MFKALARGVTRRPLLTSLVWLVLLVVGGIGALNGFGTRGLFDRLHSETASIPATESGEVLDLTQAGKDKGPAITMIVRGVDLKDAAEQRRVAALMTDERARLADIAHVDTVVDAFAFPTPDPRRPDPRAQALMSTDADGFAAVTTLAADLSPQDDKAAQRAVVDEIHAFSDRLGKEVPGASAEPLSTRVIGDAIMTQVEHDLIRGEGIGLPVALLLMVLVFGGMIAALLPMAGALTAIGLGMFGLWGLTHAMSIDSFILNVITIIGLALSIDYGLLVVSRFREEAHHMLEERGLPGDGTRLPPRAEQRELVVEAVYRTIRTAGRTVSFSALTIAVTVVGLLVMRSPILRSIGAGAVLVVVLAVLTSTTLVPALLTLVGRFLLPPSPMGRVPGLRTVFNRVADVATEDGMFSSLARWVHRHPWAVMLTVLAALVAMCLPFASLTLRSNFAEYIPADSQARATYRLVQDKYPGLGDPSIRLVVDRPPAQAGQVVDHVKGLQHVTRVSPPTALRSDSQRSVIDVKVDSADQVGPRVTSLVKDLRAWDPGYRVLVGGPAAGQLDFNESVKERAGLAVGIMAVAVLVLMFLMTGSFVVPIKALLINMLSLVASLGATWFVFEHGWFGLPRLAGLETFVVAVALSFGFGLAMDYEVFLLARIKEYWDKGLSNDEAVERGLQRSGRIITSAAAIIIAVFVGFVFGNMLAIKQIGVALAIVVLTDATLVRMLLVPATMTLLGRWNWWSPRWLRRFYERFKIVH